MYRIFIKKCVQIDYIKINGFVKIKCNSFDIKVFKKSTKYKYILRNDFYSKFEAIKSTKYKYWYTRRRDF
jgi:hypothetical protein